MHNQFYSLMQGYAKLVGLEEIGRVIDGHPIKVNGVLFSLVFDPQKDSTALFVYGDLGVLSTQHRLEDESALLAANTVFYPDLGACVAISPVNGHAILCLNLTLEELTPEALRQHLFSAAAAVKTWRSREHSIQVRA